MKREYFIKIGDFILQEGDDKNYIWIQKRSGEGFNLREERLIEFLEKEWDLTF